jgi:tetratricopeptide (TPR) repeat protein
MTGVRFFGAVTDEAGEPIPGAEVRVEVFEEGTSISAKAKSDKKGRYRVFVMHLSRAFRFTVKKEGYALFEEIYHVGSAWTRVMASVERDFTLKRGEGQPESVRIPPRVAKLYEDGVSATYAGDLATARAKFEQMVKRAPKLAVGHVALANVCMRQGDYEVAVSAAERALEMEPENSEALAIRLEAYRALGDEEKAAEAQRDLDEAKEQGQQ